jgi:hypothetical protein
MQRDTAKYNDLSCVRLQSWLDVVVGCRFRVRPAPRIRTDARDPVDAQRRQRALEGGRWIGHHPTPPSKPRAGPVNLIPLSGALQQVEE